MLSEEQVRKKIRRLYSWINSGVYSKDMIWAYAHSIQYLQEVLNDVNDDDWEEEEEDD